MINLSLKYSKTKTIVLKIKGVEIQKRFYPLSNVLKNMGHASKILAHLNKNVSTIKNSSFLISMRELNIQKAMNKKAISDFVLDKNKDKIVFTDNSGFAKFSLDPQVIYSVSGIFQAPPVFYVEPDIIEFLSKILHKFIFTIFSNSLIIKKEDLFFRIPQFLQKDNFIDNKYYYPIAQHIITNVFARFNNISVDILENLTENLVDYSAYKNFKINSISVIEAMVLRETALSVIKNNTKDLRVTAQNPDNSGEDHTKFTSLSYKQGKQPHMDFRIEKYTIQTSSNKIFFFDSKLRVDPVKTLALSKGHLSLATSMDKSLLIGRFKGDIIGTARQKGASQKEVDILKGYVLKLDKIFKDKNLTPEEKIAVFIFIRDELLLNKDIKTVIPSFIQEATFNGVYNDYILNNLIEYEFVITLIKQELMNQNLLESLVPIKGQEANVEFWHTLLLKIIKKMPETQKKLLLENFHKFKLIEQDYDF